MALLFKLRFFNDKGRPLPYPKQAAVLSNFQGLKVEQALQLANEYFLDVAEDDLVDRGVPLDGVYVSCLTLNEKCLAQRLLLYSDALEGQTLGVSVCGVHAAFPHLAESVKDVLSSVGRKKNTGQVARNGKRGKLDKPPVKKRSRRPHEIQESMVTCAVCNSQAVQAKSMVTLDCSHSFCEGCFLQLLGCQCQVQDVWAPCQCSAKCTKCSEPATREKIAAAKAAGASGHRAWEIIQRDPVCQCGQTKNPSLGLRGQDPSEAKWCIMCPNKPEEAVDLTAVTCECGLGLRQWGLPGEKRILARWCKLCPGRPEDAVQKIWKKCVCGRRDPQFGLPGERRGLARWCSTCPLKPSEAIDIVHKRCECGQHQPKFALPGEPRKNVKWCSVCPMRPISAVDLVSKRCECGRVGTPRYGLSGWERRNAKWCSTCPTRPKEAVDICCQRCECGLHTPTFGLPWENKQRWCAECPTRPAHATKVYTDACECGKRTAWYGMLGDAKPRWCTKCPGFHPDAVVFMKMRCECKKRKATHALPGNTNKPRWCNKCPGLPSTAVLCGKQRPTPVSIGVIKKGNQPPAAAPATSGGSEDTVPEEDDTLIVF